MVSARQSEQMSDHKAVRSKLCNVVSQCYPNKYNKKNTYIADIDNKKDNLVLLSKVAGLWNFLVVIKSKSRTM